MAEALADDQRRATITSAAVDEVGAAIRARPGFKGRAAKIGLDTINRVRPGFLARQIDLLLPDMANALQPWWQQALATDDPPGWLTGHSLDAAEDLLAVTDEHVRQASDPVAVAVYERLRPQAPVRIAAEMDRIATFIETHTSEPFAD